MTLDFARDDRNKDRYAGPRGMAAAGGGTEEVYRGGAGGGIGGGGGDHRPTVRSDWICEQVTIASILLSLAFVTYNKCCLRYTVSRS